MSGLQRGERIGPYRIEGPLGSGGMGDVIVAYDDRLDRRVAIKRVRHDASRDAASARERLRREARAAAGLGHPSIVQIHDILQEADGEAIVMELIAGRSVAQCLEDGPLSVEETLRLGRQVAEGLAVAHRAGLVHRDLKAENVMVTQAEGDRPGRAKILDFGLVKLIREASAEETLFLDDDPSLTKRGAVIGTVRAMSPEQAAGAVLDRRSDLFSLGILLYEMLTGRSPFRGPTPAETVKRLLVDSPRPVRALRPDVPGPVEALIERLLEKEPDRRPTDADEVADALAVLEAGVTAVAPEDAPSTGERSLGDLPTGSYEGEAPVGRDQTPPKARDRAKDPVPRRPWKWGLSAAVLAVLVALGWFSRGAAGVPADPLRVLVERPEIVGESTAEIDLVASGVRIAALAVLADLEEVAPVEASVGVSDAGSPRAAAFAEAADEVLAATVEGEAGNALITLRRIRGSGGEVLWASTFHVPRRAADAWVLAEAVRVQLQRAFPDRSIRTGASKREIGDEDYADFVQTLERIDSGEVDWAPELARLEAISARAPRFMPVHLRGVGVAWTLHSDTRDVAFLDRGETMLTRARVLAPEDPWPWFWTFRIALARGERDAAEQALATLVAVAPNSIGVQLSRASLAERDGDLAAAVAAMTALVERVPSWQNLYRLADLEQRRGDVDSARGHLEQLVSRLPANTWALAKLARLELVFGDLARAIRLYQRAIELKRHRSYFTNIGLAYFLQRRYDDAIASYREALALQPAHLITRFNLADAELARGDRASAHARYRRIVQELEAHTLDAAERMTVAQCLAQLGASKRAVALTLETLQEQREDLEVVYQAALVYTLVGDHASALVNAEKALAGGYPRRWFTIPDFDPLRTDPGFRALLGDRS